MNELRTAIGMNVLLVLFSGTLFPLLVWIGGQALFPFQANGSLLRDKEGKAYASQLIGQKFSSPRYFHPRPSAAGNGYDGANSSGTNLGPLSSKLIEGIADDPSTTAVDETYLGIVNLAAKYREENGVPGEIKLPADAVTRSGSGLDPEISPANALLQAERVAKARGISADEVRRAVARVVRGRFLGLFGEPRVNVVELNASLDGK